MTFKPNWQHIAATLLTVAPIALHTLQVLKPSWYTAILSVAGPLWLLFQRGVLVDPGVKQGGST